MSSPFAGDPSAVRGAITPLITPFTDDGELDLEPIARLIDWQLEHGIARHLGRRLHRRADLADRRRAHRGDARGGGGDRRPRSVPARHRHAR